MARTQFSEKEFLEKLTQITERNLTDGQFGVSELAREMGMVRSTLHRRVKSITGTSVSQFIRGIRLKLAMKLLKESSSTISEVAFECGFQSVSYFTTCFHDHYGYPPGEVGKRESQEHNSDDLTDHYTKSVIRKKRSMISFLFGGIVLVIAAIAFVFILKPLRSSRQILDKSIAVLPFRNDSPDEEQMYFINGTMESILDNLGKIKDLRVVSRNSVEQYRKNPKPTPEIAEEINVSYILEGSGQKDGDKIRLAIQLLDARNDKRIWSDLYDREIEDIFLVQSEIAQLVADEIEAIITPEEKQLIEKIPTTSLTAHDFYQRGRDEHLKYQLNHNNREALEIAEDRYYKALEYDSKFAPAYAGLALVYWTRHYWGTFFSEEFLDSVLILSNTALSYDDQLAEAYTVRGDYYREKGFVEQAITEYDNAILFNPNDWEAYNGKGQLYRSVDLLKSLVNFHKASSLNHGTELPTLLRSIGMNYHNAGFIEIGNKYIEDALKLDGDSTRYYISLASIEWIRGNYANSNEYYSKAYATDSINIRILEGLGLNYLFLGHFEESLKYYKKYVERLDELEILTINRMDRIGYAYWQNGFKEKAEYYFDEQIKYSNRIIELGREWAQNLFTYNDLAGIYAFRGEKDKAYENLRIYNQRQTMPRWAVTLIKDDHLFDNIRDESEFQQIVRDVEAKYRVEHERVGKWLDENDML